MSKPSVNPFFEIDFSKFADFSKLAGDFKSPFNSPLNLDALYAGLRRNIEAVTAVNQAAYEGIQSIARRQSDLIRQSMEETASLVSALVSSPASPEERILRHAEASKAAVDKCIANARDVADTLSKCNNQAIDVVSGRLNEGLEELRGLIKKQQAA